MEMSGHLVLADEKIFHTIQGEGKFIGYPSSFIRMSRCNLRCSWKNEDGTITKCDTPHTSFNPEINEIKIENIVSEIAQEGFNHVVVSGGEPFFQRGVTELINSLVDNGHYVTVETNGTIYRPNKAQFLSISPKLSSSCADVISGHNHNNHRLNFDTLETMITNHSFQFKFVINTESEIDEILEIKRALFERTGIDINDHIWLMPQGINGQQLDFKLEWIAEVCKQFEWKMTDRMHIRIWGSKKGV
jgi:7-carboxy-7-deazaguanine synthase